MHDAHLITDSVWPGSVVGQVPATAVHDVWRGHHPPQLLHGRHGWEGCAGSAFTAPPHRES